MGAHGLEYVVSLAVEGTSGVVGIWSQHCLGCWGSLLRAGQGVAPWALASLGHGVTRTKVPQFPWLRPLGCGGALPFPAGHREPTGLPSGSVSHREKKISLCCLQHMELPEALGKPWLVGRQFVRATAAGL